MAWSINRRLTSMAATRYRSPRTTSQHRSGGALTDTDTIAITVNAVNDGPTNTVPASRSAVEDIPLPSRACRLRMSIRTLQPFR